ncbi:MAG: hypothetical protein JJU34_16595 [Lunatimonas sp.]|uniref:DUF5908 family protein n=1 Tax=Lunatimonas sp. TaxID=2060141 RepID=UPI00263ADFBF|nr:DUF5908 family protein [Lunatimonas sp.]MCC5938898.1 hypothetical protein [Lunatimonas sp.]
MPIEIKELTIRIHVADGGEGQRPNRPGGTQEDGNKKKAELMEDLMEVLRLQKER